MFRKLGLALGIVLALATSAAAQNTTCSDRPASDSSNACANTRFVHGQASVPINVMTLGAKCDWNGTTGTDDTAAIQAALNTYKSVLIPQNCAISSTLTFGNLAFATITGINSASSTTNINTGSSVLVAMNANLPVISVVSTIPGLVIQNLGITRSIAATAGGNGIQFNGYNDNPILDNVEVEKQYIGLDLTASGYGILRNSYIHDNISDNVYCDGPRMTIAAQCQWYLSDILSSRAGRGGTGWNYNVVAPATAAIDNKITMGTWAETKSFSGATGGANFKGNSNVAVQGVRLAGGFYGESGGAELNFDTFNSAAGPHQISDVFVEINTNGTCINITGNNATVNITGGSVIGCNTSGINNSATQLTVSGTQILNNTTFGIVNGGVALVTGSNLNNNTSGPFSNSSVYIGRNNTPTTANTVLPVVEGGTGIASGTTGNVLCFSATTTITTCTAKRVMTVNTSLFVTTTGNDANTCTNNTTDACLTIQRAYDVLVDGYYIVGKNVVATISVANGTYTAGLITSRCVSGQNGPGGVQIIGNATPGNVLISVTSNDAFGLGETATGNGTQGCTQITIGGMKLVTTTSGHAINVAGGGVGITFGTPGFPIEFGAAAQDHIVANHSAWVIAGTNYTISGSAIIHAAAISNSVTAIHNVTVTLTGVPAFTYFAYADTNGTTFASGMTFVGTATGSRYFAGNGGKIYTNSASATYLPGNAAGSEAMLGQYIGSGAALPTGFPLLTSGIQTYLTPGTGFTTAAAINVGTAGSFLVNGGAGVFSTITVGTTATIGSSSANGLVSIDGKNSGTGGGSGFLARLVGVANIGMGNISSIVTGGAYDATPAIYFSTNGIIYNGGNSLFVNALSTASTSSSTGSLVVGGTGGLGVGGAIWAGTYVATTPTTVGGLPSCAAGTKSARMFVTDANAAFTAGIGAVVAAGGANNVPVTCDGTNWRIGANDNIPASIMRKYA